MSYVDTPPKVFRTGCLHESGTHSSRKSPAVFMKEMTGLNLVVCEIKSDLKREEAECQLLAAVQNCQLEDRNTTATCWAEV